ncbi:hypothetical protein SLE2022_298320 [Rubroshorea leprosula]
MRFPSFFFFLSLLLIFFFLVHGKVDATEFLVDSGNSVSRRGAEYGKESVKSKEGNSGSVESFLHEDYVYTNSVP